MYCILRYSNCILLYSIVFFYCILLYLQCLLRLGGNKYSITGQSVSSHLAVPDVLSLNQYKQSVDKTWSSVSNSTQILDFSAQAVSLIPYLISLILTPCPLALRTVPFEKIQVRVLLLVIVVVIPSKIKVNSQSQA